MSPAKPWCGKAELAGDGVALPKDNFLRGVCRHLQHKWNTDIGLQNPNYNVTSDIVVADARILKKPLLLLQDTLQSDTNSQLKSGCIFETKKKQSKRASVQFHNLTASVVHSVMSTSIHLSVWLHI